jgi:hypothetical protein
MALDPTIPLGVKPIDFLGSAGNLLNLARGAQALEQEQAMNPIQQQKAALELKTLRETQDAEINRQKGLSRQAVTGADVAEFNQAGQIEGVMQRTLNPLYRPEWIANAVKNPQQAINDIRLSTDRAIAGGVPVDRAEAYKASMYAVLADAKRANNPDLLGNWMFNNLVGQLPPEKQQPLLAPGGAPPVSAGGVPGYPVLGPSGNTFQSFQVGPRPTAPAMPQEGVQTGSVPLSTGIQERPVDLSLSETGPANKQGAGVPLMQPAAPAQPQGVTAEMMSARPVGAAGAMKMPDLLYPVRTPGQAFLPVQGEDDDRALGQKYKNGLIAAQPVMTKARRDLEEVISMADKIEKAGFFDSAGVMGAAERKLKSALGNTDYQKLSKDLANARIATIQAKGGSLDTVGGQELVRISNGDETYSPIVLKSVAQRAYGDVIATELEGRAAAAFAQRYGDANHNTFKQMWSKNADSRIFEIMALPKLIQDKSDRIKAANEILKNATPKEREEFNRKYQNILRLEQTGSL